MTVDNETSVTDADFGIDIDSVDVACRVAMVYDIFQTYLNKASLSRFNSSTRPMFSETSVNIPEPSGFTPGQWCRCKRTHFFEVVRNAHNWSLTCVELKQWNILQNVVFVPKMRRLLECKRELRVPSKLAINRSGSANHSCLFILW